MPLSLLTDHAPWTCRASLPECSLAPTLEGVLHPRNTLGLGFTCFGGIEALRTDWLQ
jgi:hypothetical protein